MTAPKGTDAYTTKESLIAEQNHKTWVQQIVSEYGSDFELRPLVAISELVCGDENNQYAYLKRRYKGFPAGSSSVYEADGGWIYYKGELIGVCEHKYQDADKNACERAGKYVICMHRHAVFISASGYGFSEEAMTAKSTATAKFAAIAKNGHKRLGLERGVGFSLNESEEKFKETFRYWFEYLISQETDYS
jgi:hypothetical protein|tara:strand:- start:9 stop:581 length:573 start_codon:yes stop_codon:yes gene_type:complete